MGNEAGDEPTVTTGIYDNEFDEASENINRVGCHLCVGLLSSPCKDPGQSFWGKDPQGNERSDRRFHGENQDR